MQVQRSVVPEWGVGRLKQDLVSEQSWAGCGSFILELCGDVFGRRSSKQLQSFLQHLLPALQSLQHSVTQRRAHRQICVKQAQADTRRQ